MMQPLILDTNFDAIRVIDAYEAFIWTERYSRAGDFELYLSASVEMINTIIPGRYLYLEESNKLMIIETVEITTNYSEGNKLKATGRSLESILSRRIVWDQTILNGYLEGQIKKLLNDNALSPTDSTRKISELSFENCNDPDIAQMRIRAQYTGDNIYDVLVEICEYFGIGFEVYFNKNTNKFVFRLYNGKDRSYDQDTNENVIFSPEFDNILESDYVNNHISHRTVALVAGEDLGYDRKRTTVIVDPVSGLNRKELYVDARDIQQDEDITDAEYYEMLEQRGQEKMTEHIVVEYFGASMETSIGFKYGEDFGLGDIVQVQNEYGINAQCRVTELIRSMKSSGYYEYPTFEII